MPEAALTSTLQALSRALSILGPDASYEFGPDPRLEELIVSLPRLTEADLGSQRDGVCPICLVQFRAHLAEEETASEADLGVTRLESTCKHIFCRKDISMWIRQLRNSCPTCRRPLLAPLPAENNLRENRIPNGEPNTATQTADTFIREIIEGLGPLDDPGSSDQADLVRRLVETFLPTTSESQDFFRDEDYLEHSELEMYA